MGTPLIPLSYLFGDNRSYLYPGRSKKDLSAAERQLEDLYDKIDRPNNRITPTQFFQTPEASALLDRIYGGLTDRIPPGSQIVMQTPSKVTYRDQDGYEHTVTRKPDGTVTQATNRPAILPNQQQNSMLDFLQQRAQQGLTGPVQFADIPPELQAQLDSISAAERGNIARQAEDEWGKLVAALYGNNVNKSSIANEAAARFAEALGRLNNEQAANDANRRIGLRDTLTRYGQVQNDSVANLYAALSGQGTQRDIAGAGLDVDLKRLAEGSRQFDASYYLDQLRSQLERDAFNAENSGFNKFLKTLNAASGLLQGGATAYGAYKGGK